jgi:hypothetical protein
MTDNIIDKLEKMADSYKNGELDITYEEYETICQAWSEIEILRNDRDTWKRLFIRGYESDATTDEAMYAYRKEKW